MVWLKREDIEDIMVTALEGGIGYWSILDNMGEEFENAPDDEAVAETAARIIADGGELRFLDAEDESEEWSLTLESLNRGIELFIKCGYDRYGAFKNDRFDPFYFDAETADVLIQLSIFGEVIFG